MSGDRKRTRIRGLGNAPAGIVDRHEQYTASDLLTVLEALGRHDDGMPLDAEGRESIELHAKSAVTRREMSRYDAAVHFIMCMALLPRTSPPSGSRQKIPRNIYLPGQVLERWATEATWVDKNGVSKVLPISGSGHSFAALVRSIDSRADVPWAMTYLLSIKAVIKVGNCLMRKKRKATHQGQGSLLPELDHKGVLAHLRTDDTHYRTGVRPQYGYTTDGQIPKSRVKAFRDESAGVCDGALLTLDESMSRMRSESTRGEKDVVSVTAGAYINDGEPIASVIPKSRLSVINAIKRRRRPARSSR